MDRRDFLKRTAIGAVSLPIIGKALAKEEELGLIEGGYIASTGYARLVVKYEPGANDHIGRLDVVLSDSTQINCEFYACNPASNDFRDRINEVLKGPREVLSNEIKHRDLAFRSAPYIKEIDAIGLESICTQIKL